MLKPTPEPTPKTGRPLTLRAVTAKGANHVWHLALTTVPTIGVAVVVDHFSRRAIGSAHLISNHGVQFTAEEFGGWCRHRGIQQRFGAIGKYGSLAVIETFIKAMKNEWSLVDGPDEPPLVRPTSKPHRNAAIVGHLRIGGLHHRCEWRQAA